MLLRIELLPVDRLFSWYPHEGQLWAVSEIDFVHSGHSTNAISLLLSRRTIDYVRQREDCLSPPANEANGAELRVIITRGQSWNAKAAIAKRLCRQSVLAALPPVRPKPHQYYEADPG